MRGGRKGVFEIDPRALQRALAAFFLAASLGGPAALALPQPSSQALPDLEAVLPPRVDSLEADVQELLREARSSAATAIESGDATASAAAFGRLCLVYLRYELYDASAPCLEQMRELEPDVFHWPYYQHLLFDAVGDLRGMRSSLEAALALLPDDPTTLIRAGDLHLADGELDRAEKSFRDALEARPQSSAARFGLGRVAAERGDLQAAAQWLEAARAGQPEGTIVHHHLGMVYRQAGDLEKARSELARNRQLPIALYDPWSERLARLGIKGEELFEEGVRALGAGRVDDAIAILRRLLEVNPEDAEAHYTLARALVESQETESAERHLRRAIELRPDYGQAHFNLAILLGREGRREEAGSHIEQAAATDPENLGWRVMYAQVLAERGEGERAISELGEVLQLDPAMVDAYRALGALHAALGENQQAAAAYAELTRRVPDDAAARFGLGMSLLRAADYDGARSALDAAVERFPEDADLIHLLARLLAIAPGAETRDGDRAVTLAERALDLELTLEHAETMAMALAAAGRFEEAVEWQQRVLDQEKSAAGVNSPVRLQHLEQYRNRQPVRLPGG